MSDYVFIASESRLQSGDATHCLDLAVNLAELGHRVSVFMVQNGVFSARGDDQPLAAAARAGISLLADDFSLRERGISERQVNSSVRVSSIDFVVDRLAAGDRVIWH